MLLRCLARCRLRQRPFGMIRRKRLFFPQVPWAGILLTRAGVGTATPTPDPRNSYSSWASFKRSYSSCIGFSLKPGHDFGESPPTSVRQSESPLDFCPSVLLRPHCLHGVFLRL